MAYKAVSKSFTRVFIWFALGTEGLGFRIVWWVRVSKVFDSFSANHDFLRRLQFCLRVFKFLIMGFWLMVQKVKILGPCNL